MRTVIRLWFLLSAFAVGAQDSALVDTNGVLVHPTNFISANGIAPLASPALSGNPTAPTATVGDNDTSISTTAFVTAAIEALKALQLWQNTNAVLTALAKLTGGNSSNFFKGTGSFAQVTTNDIPDLVTMLGGLQPLDSDLTSIAGLTWADTNTFLRGDKTLSRDGQNWTNLTATQLLIGTVPTNVLPGQLSYLSTGSADALTTGTLTTDVLPGTLATLSTWNGGGRLTNLAYPQVYWFSNQNTTTNWTIPTGAKSLRIAGVSQGGAGASGRRGSLGLVNSGGAGGGGGGYGEVIVEDVGLLWTNSLMFIIPAIRDGGPSVTTDNSNGTNGTAATYQYVYVGNSSSTTNLLLFILGGGAGNLGDSDGAPAGSGSTVGSSVAGGAGGATPSAGTGGLNAASVALGLVGTGGGGGGSITTGGTPSAGGNGGLGPLLGGFTSGPSGGAVASNGTNYLAAYPLTIVSYFHGWPGAGGGGSSTNSAGGNGANGYWFGSGGGGGGASLNGFPSGKGGDGGPGAFMVICYWTCPAISFSDWVGAVAQWTYDTVSLLKHLVIPEIEFNSNEVTQ